MKRSLVCRVLLSSLFAIALVMPHAPAHAQAGLPIRNLQGGTHGFLLIRSEAGTILGYGEFTQLVPHGDRVTSRLTLHFRDGSLDDDTTIFTQRGKFHLISDHHTQRGPFFAKPMDMLVEENGNVTTRELAKAATDGKPQVEVTHVDLPDDLANGLITTVLTNVRPDTAEFTVGMVASVGKGRLIKVGIQQAGQASVSCVTGLHRTASIFQLRPEIGGIAGVIAPIVGKQPGDQYVWVVEEQAPVVVRVVGELASGGPVVSLELAGTSFPAVSSDEPPAVHNR